MDGDSGKAKTSGKGFRCGPLRRGVLGGENSAGEGLARYFGSGGDGGMDVENTVCDLLCPKETREAPDDRGCAGLVGVGAIGITGVD